MKTRSSPSATLRRAASLPSELPSAEVARDYWATIIGDTQRFELTPDLKAWQQVPHGNHTLSSDEKEDYKIWRDLLRWSRPRKASGPDGIPNLLWKKVGAASRALFEWAIKGKSRRLRIPAWFNQGKIVLLPKKGDLTLPENYRPIACLNTSAKLVTGLLTRWITKHVSDHEIMPVEQRALTKGTWGCTHALVLDQTICRDAIHAGAPLAVAWLDFAKAFDSIPHGYVRYILSAIGIHPRLRGLLSEMMRQWKVRYVVGSGRTIDVSKLLKVRCGVLQGDTLSPLLFGLAVAPISHAINRRFCGYETATSSRWANPLRLTHTLYMDDLKLYARSMQMVKAMVGAVEGLGKAIGLRLSPAKCAMMACNTSLGKGSAPTDIPIFGAGQTYKYLGIEQSLLPATAVSWERVEGLMLARLAAILDENFTMRQTVQLFNSMVIPVGRYLFTSALSCGYTYVAQCKRAKEFDVKVRKELKDKKFRFRTSSIERLYVSSSHGGVGLMSMLDTYKLSLVYAWCYLHCQEEFAASRRLFKSLSSSSKRTLLSDVRAILEEAKLEKTIVAQKDPIEVGISIYNSGVESYFHQATSAARLITRMLRNIYEEKRVAKWRVLAKAGAVTRDLKLDQRCSYLWILRGWVSKVSFRNAIGAQEQCLFTRSLDRAARSKLCRWCHEASETTPHVVAACRHFRTTIILERHNSVCRELYYQLCMRYGFSTVHFTQVIPPISENNRAKILYDVNVVTRLQLKHNRPDMVLFDKEDGTITIIEVAVAWYTTLPHRESVKYHKYATNSQVENVELLPYSPGENLVGHLNALYATEYKMGARVVPIVIGCTGEVLPTLLGYLSALAIPKPEKVVEKLQRGVIQGTSRLIRAHLAIE